MMELKNVTGMYEPTVRDASFTLRKGEVLGISGLVGSRRTELLELILVQQRFSLVIFILMGNPMLMKIQVTLLKIKWAL